MKILHVNQNAHFLGGVEQILFDTARGLADENWPQGLLHSDPDCAKDFLSPFAMTASNLEIIDRFQPDVILIHKFQDVARIQEYAGNSAVVRMVHDHDLVCLRRHKYFPLSGRICEQPAGVACYKNLCVIQRGSKTGISPITFGSLRKQRMTITANSQLNRYIVGSRWMKEQLVRNGFAEDRIDIIAPIPRSQQTSRLLRPSKQPEVLYVGQVIRGKGVDLLLHALSRLTSPWRANIVGDGNYLQTCRNLAAELGISDRVQFRGWVPHDQLETQFERSLFAVVPSRWPEPFGMVGPEAMSRGRPVVAFDVGGIPDWLEDGVSGLLVPPGDINGLARAMDRLLSKPDLAESLGQGAARVSAHRLTHRGYLTNLRNTLENTL